MKTCLFFASIIIAMYSADLGKQFLTIIAFLMGNPLGLVEYGRIVDIIFVILVTFFTLAVLMFKKKSVRQFYNMPVALLVFLAMLMTISLMESSDELSMENYYRFLGGNLLLFLGVLVCGQSPEAIKRIWNIWIFNSVILATISSYLFLIGITWSSGRSELFPGTGIRSGYYCGLSVIYLASKIILDSRHKLRHSFLRGGGICIGILGVLLSGSKFSLFLVMASLIMMVFLKLLITKSMGRSSLLFMFSIFTLITILIFKVLVGFEMSGRDMGNLSNVYTTDSFQNSTYGRIDLSKHYFELGMESPLIGHGISAAYSLTERTHSMLLSLFVQVGLLGVMAYLLFLVGILVPGFRRVRLSLLKSYINSDKSLILSTFVAVMFFALKAEATGDVAANRELWFFAGMFLVLNGSSYNGLRVPLYRTR